MRAMSDTATTAIDLSRLSPPAFVEQIEQADILSALIARLVDDLPWFDATVRSDPAVKLLSIQAYRETLARAAFDDAARQLLLAFAVGENLDHLGARMDVARLVVDPGDPTAGIAATYETDDDFRARIQLAPERLSVAGPASAYAYHARSAAGTIRDARASSPAPGEVVVALLSATGDGTATAAEIAAVENALSAETVRPLTDFVTVQSATAIPFTVEAYLTLFAGPDPVVVLANAQAALDTYLSGARRIGRDVTRAGIIAALMVAGVQNVALPSPIADIVADDTQFALCVGKSVGVAGYDD